MAQYTGEAPPWIKGDKHSPKKYTRSMDETYPMLQVPQNPLRLKADYTGDQPSVLSYSAS